jgi:cytochrome c peroxidase
MRIGAALALILFGVFEAHGADSDYVWRLPPGFPVPDVPSANPMSNAKVQLGCRLFFETRLSATGAYSCASCHRPELAFTDGRGRAVGATGGVMTRGSMSLANVAYNPALTWGNHRTNALETQMEQPLFNEHPIEIGMHRDGDTLARLVRDDPSYEAAFRNAFPDEAPAVSTPNMIESIAAFERTLVSGRSPFDRYVYDDDRDALSEQARQGMALFYSDRTGCGGCHSGLTFSGPIRHRGLQIPPTATFARNGGYRGGDDAGLEAVSGDIADRGKFRVPTLRNVAVTAPYMHDGSLATLDAVIAHYDAGGGVHDPGAAPPVDPAVKPLHLSDAEKSALIAFLRSLTDEEFLSRPYSRCDTPVID